MVPLLVASPYDPSRPDALLSKGNDATRDCPVRSLRALELRPCLISWISGATVIPPLTSGLSRLCSKWQVGLMTGPTNVPVVFRMDFLDPAAWFLRAYSSSSPSNLATDTTWRNACATSDTTVLTPAVFTIACAGLRTRNLSQSMFLASGLAGLHDVSTALRQKDVMRSDYVPRASVTCARPLIGSWQDPSQPCKSSHRYKHNVSSACVGPSLSTFYAPQSFAAKQTHVNGPDGSSIVGCDIKEPMKDSPWS